MDKCLLCLSEQELFININSNEWKELNVKLLIEKHLWPMDFNIITPLGVCYICWQELSNFHKFFLKIQEAQNELTGTLNNEQISESIEELEHSYSNRAQNESDTVENSNNFVVEEIKNEITESSYDNELDPLKELEKEEFLNNENYYLEKELKNSNSEMESSENIECTVEITSEDNKTDEKDKFIAEHFKITCCLCQTTMKTFHDMCQHFKMKHKIRGYVMCCSKKIFRRCYLIDHINFHLNPNYFQCSKCHKVLADRLCLNSHLKTHEENLTKNHSCDVCGKSFMCQSKLKIHQTTHLPEEEKKFDCTDCGKKFANKYLLSNHVHAVHLKVNSKICDICGKSLCSAEYLERHMLEHEGKPAPTFSCDICGLILTSMKGLKRHKTAIHPIGGHQEYTCTICSKVSSNINAHKWHIKFSHEMGYDHKCKICDKAFKKARTLKEHMATHTGNVLYTCTWCPKTFNSNANMHSHRKKMHPVEWLEITRKKYSGKMPPKKMLNENHLNISLN
ncbi:transcription factor grauzone-like [Cochliomyia hominivorax]